MAPVVAKTKLAPRTGSVDGSSIQTLFQRERTFSPKCEYFSVLSGVQNTLSVVFFSSCGHDLSGPRGKTKSLNVPSESCSISS
jgi:hypothetical protein